MNKKALLSISNNSESHLIAVKPPLCVQLMCRGEGPIYLFQTQYTKIVEDWSGYLQHVAWQITKNRPTAEDIVQEAFMELWQQRVKIIPENPVGWLLKVVVNLSSKYIRRTVTKTHIYRNSSYNQPTSYSEVEERLIEKEDGILLSKVLNKLPSQQRLVFHLSREEGLCRREIANLLKLSPNTVKVHLLRAVKFVKEHTGCCLLFVFFFICNNFFLKSSNTDPDATVLYNTSCTIEEQPTQIAMNSFAQESIVYFNR